MRLSKKKILALCMSGALILSSVPVVYMESTAANKSSVAVVKLSETNLKLVKGKQKKIKVTVKNVSKLKKVTFKSKNKKIASVTSKGVVKAVKAGSTKIEVTVSYIPKNSQKVSKKTLKCTVKVSKPEDTTDVLPDAEAQPTATPVPAVYGEAGKVSEYSKEKSNYSLSVDASDKVHDISDILYGIFIEDINFAADGGLYAEMVQNRSFEFTKLASDNEKHAWNNVGDVTANVVKDDKTGCLNANNPNYMVIENKSDEEAGIANKGFLDGMSIKKNAGYDFSIYAKGIDGYTGSLNVKIMNGKEVAGSGTIEKVTSDWKKYELKLDSNVTSNRNVKLQVTIPKGKIAVDMVSLFPQDTYKGRKNGLRKDLAQKLEELHPGFLRFPGGCVVEGATIETRYNWKDSIGADASGQPFEFNGTYGDVAARKQGQNIWTDEWATNDQNPSFMTYGLGFYEYFQLAEDIGAIGVPVINCGKCCMGQSNGNGPALDSAEFKQYIQDALDLVEFCRGDKTTKWGKIRIAMGHEEPFELKYIGIGNEQWGDDFFKHYEAFVDAFNDAKKTNPELYGDIELMFTAGVDDGDSGKDIYMQAYNEAAKWLKAHPDKTINDFAGAIDHHYYNEPSWFLTHTDYYDEKNYSRDTDNMTTSTYGGGMNVFLGEYAAQSNTWKAALSEAAYMTGLERNGDIVKMAAYAPLFGNLTALHWSPDLIWFNNNTVTSSVNYYVQKIFAKNAGTTLLKSDMTGATVTSKPFGGKVGVGTWNTAAKFDNVKVVSKDTGKILGKETFTKAANFSKYWEQATDGVWSVKNGKLVQSSDVTNTITYGNQGSVAYFGNSSWKNYTYTVEATKISGQEGFMIPFSVGDKNENYFWNIGGWNNTVSCLQKVSGGSKSGQLAGTVTSCTIADDVKYNIKIEVKDRNVKCYLDGLLYVDYTIPETEGSESYQVVSTDKTEDVIVKLVNVTGADKTFAVDIANAGEISDEADVDVVAGNSETDDNILGKEEIVTLKSDKVSGIKDKFNYTVPKYSVTVLRIKHNGNN